MEQFEYRAKLLAKMNQVRTELVRMGTIKKDKTNAFDKYSYLSESAYKKLTNQLFSTYKLEYTQNVLSVDSLQGTEKQPFYKKVMVAYTIYDVETGFALDPCVVVGEGADKGDKGIYKAMTGAFKYWIANTFAIATGDDAENEGVMYATDSQIAQLQQKLDFNTKSALFKKKGIKSLSRLTFTDADEILENLEEKEREKGGIPKIEVK